MMTAIPQRSCPDRSELVRLREGHSIPNFRGGRTRTGRWAVVDEDKSEKSTRSQID